MTVGSVNNVCSPRIVPERALKGLGNSIHLIEMHNREGAARLPSVPCRSGYTVGSHEQRAHADAISTSYDVLVAARDSESNPRELAALEKSLARIGPTPQEAYGPRLMNKFTLWGAVLKAVEHALEGAPDNKNLVACKRELESAIVKVGLRAGEGKGIADGGYHGDRQSKKLTEALMLGQEAVLACREAMGDSVLLDGIVSAVLPDAMMQSLRENMPDVAASYQGRMHELDFSQVLQKKYADATWSSVEHHMQTGCPEAFAIAVFALLKLPEYIMEGVPDSGGPEQPAGTPVPDGRFPPIPAMPSGGNQAINQNNVDLSEFGKAFSKAAEQFRSIGNLTQKDCIELGERIGWLERENGVLRGDYKNVKNRNADLKNENAGLLDENTDLRNRVAYLEHKFDQSQGLLNTWARAASPIGKAGNDDHTSGQDSGNGSSAGGDLVLDSDRSFAHDRGPIAPRNSNDNAEGRLGGGGAHVLSDEDRDNLRIAWKNLQRHGGGDVIDPQDRQFEPSLKQMVGAGTGFDELDAGDGTGGDDDVSSIDQAEADKIIFGDIMRLQERRDRIDAARDAALRGSVQTPVLMQPNAGVSVAGPITVSVAQRVRHFESMLPPQTRPTGEEGRRNATNGGAIRSSAEAGGVGEYLARRQLPRVTAAGLVKVEEPIVLEERASRPRSVTGDLRSENLDEFKDLVQHRAAHHRPVSPIKAGDTFRADFEGKGGLVYRPFVEPKVPGEKVMEVRGTSQLERLFERLNQGRLVSPTPLREVFGQSAEPTPARQSDAEAAATTDPSHHGNWLLQTPKRAGQDVRKLFDDAASMLRQKHLGGVMKSLMGGS